MKHLIEYARAERITAIVGLVLADNSTMIGMARQLGFQIVSNQRDPAVIDVTLTFGEGNLTASDTR